MSLHEHHHDDDVQQVVTPADYMNAVTSARVTQAFGIPVAIAIGAFLGSPFIGAAVRLYQWAAGT